MYKIALRLLWTTLMSIESMSQSIFLVEITLVENFVWSTRYFEIFSLKTNSPFQRRRKMPSTFSSAFNETEMKMEMKIQFQLSFFFAEKTKKEMSLKKNYLSQGYPLAFSEVVC